MQAKVYEFLKDKKASIVTNSNKDALEIKEVYKYLNIPFSVFPDFRATLGDDLRSFRSEIFELNNALYKFYKGAYFISPYSTILKKLPVKRYYKDFNVSIGEELNLDEFKKKLFYWGYENVDIVSEKGEMSIRGDIIDIWPINYDKPFRISLFDVEVESIRIFDETNQKSLEEVDEFTIIPAIAALDENEYKEIEEKIRESKYATFYKDFYSLGFWYLERNYLDNFYLTNDLTQEIEEYKEFHKEINPFVLQAPIIPEAKKCKDLKISNLKEFLELHKGKSIEILAKNEVLLKQADILDFIKLNKPLVKWIESDARVNIICPDKVIISLNPPEFEKKKRSDLVLDELKKGDFVVHEAHGIGKFNGLKRMEVLGKIGEFAEILYANDDKLLLPVENLEKIERYIAPGGVIPTFDKLGKSSFAKKLIKVKEKVFAIAANIIKLAAKREVIEPIKLQFDGVEEFIKKAPFIHTPDQKKAIDEIINDFKTKVMDRLLTGDVGFGKTEVAMVASYIVAKSGYQVAVIAPTTILANQHYESFKERFKDTNIKIAKLDRFTSSKEKKEILEKVKNGEIDILISTHAGLNVEYKNLGLLIIDEEHKFGVKQKEKLKEMAENIHTLYMSATPIPRTLNMALSQIKSISTLESAPKGKKETKTFVKEWDENLIKEAILREIRRGGQVFYIYNNIAYIEQKKKELQNILPNLRILVLHAKLTPAQIEKGLVDFINGKYDLALTTTIVESGIHIPNVNTVIVENADKFGIADLHQIRGRVGRGKHEGYAYFLVKDKENLSEDAKKRLIALEENSFLGSGQVLALRDLEIRGGGNIVGAEQSGQIKGVGYNLYIKMLEDTLKEMLGKKEEKQDVEVKLNINAYISNEVVNEDRLRLDLYKRLSRAKTLDEVYEIEKEIVDRFGKLDKVTQNFIDKIKIKVLAKNKGIKSISNFAQNITIIYNDDTKEIIKAPAKDDEIILETIFNKLKS